MGHPKGALLGALAPRIRANLDRIEELAESGADAFEDTQLLVSLLGVLVFPQQRSDEALGAILRGYEPLAGAVTVLHAVARGVPVGPMDPRALPTLPRLLRNGLAHANVLPIRAGDAFGGIRVWNEDDDGRVTFVADLAFPEVRRLARHVLTQIAEGDPRLANPDDPLIRLEGRRTDPPRRRSAPKVNDTVWDALVIACGGDADRARTEMDRTLRARAKAIEAAR